MHELYSNMDCHFKVVCHTEKGIKLNSLPITLMDVLETMYCFVALAFSLFSWSLFPIFFIHLFFFLPFVCCVIPFNFLPSSLSFSRALFFFFSSSPNFCSAPPDSQGCVPLCPFPWLRLFLCFLILFLLHLPVFLSNLPTVFAFLFSLTR